MIVIIRRWVSLFTLFFSHDHFDKPSTCFRCKQCICLLPRCRPLTIIQPSSTKAAAPITQQINATRERTKELGAKVRSSLSGLTPHENIYNIPNFLTVTRLVAAPAIAYLVLHDQHTWALALFAYAGITDMIDGWMARKWKLQTVVGSVIDPGADKALMIVLITTLAVKGALPCTSMDQKESKTDSI